MKRIHLLPLAAVLLGFLFTTAFTQKAYESTPPSKGTAPAFIGTRWQMSAFQLNPVVDFDGDGKPDADLLPFMSPCNRDNSLVFEPNGKITISEESVRCDKPVSNSGKPSSWKFDEVSQTIQIVNQDSNGSSTTWEILSVTSNVLKIRTTATHEGKTSHTTITWKAL